MSASNSSLAHIARPYASALYDIAKGEKSIPSIEKSLNKLAQLIEKNDDFASFLASPIISADKKASVIDAILKKMKLPKIVSNFVKLVAKNARLFALPAMIASFGELAAKGRKEVSAEVISAKPLSASQLKSLSATLKKKIGKTVTLKTHVDADLIGGLIVKVGSKMIDNSLQTKLSAMQSAMKEVG